MCKGDNFLFYLQAKVLLKGLVHMNGVLHPYPHNHRRLLVIPSSFSSLGVQR